jgi:DNA-binding NarL/FixJ family response regulator
MNTEMDPRLDAVRDAAPAHPALGMPGQRDGPRGPYRAARNDPLGLTSRQRCVLGLLQQGLSNRAIARRLFRSERTVEHHVSALFTKLRIACRAELGSLDSKKWVQRT